VDQNRIGVSGQIRIGEYMRMDSVGFFRYSPRFMIYSV
jgi:hypothetical protein